MLLDRTKTAKLQCWGQRPQRNGRSPSFLSSARTSLCSSPRSFVGLVCSLYQFRRVSPRTTSYPCRSMIEHPILYSLHGEILRALLCGKCPISHAVPRRKPGALTGSPHQAIQFSYSRRFPLSGPRYRLRSGVKAREATPQGLGLDAASGRDRLAARGKRRTLLVCCFISSLTQSEPLPSVLHPPAGPHTPGISTDLSASAVPGRRSRLCAPASLHWRIAS